MVMPRSRSMSIESSTCSTISRSCMAPVSWISRSASVDLPWSMWATMEKLRMFAMAPAVMDRQITPQRDCGKDALVPGKRNAQIFPQRCAFICGAEQPAALQFRHHEVDKVIDGCGYLGWQ